MKKNEMVIMKCYTCSFPFAKLQPVVPGDGDELEKYIKKLVKSGTKSMKAKHASVSPDLENILPADESKFQSFCKKVAEDMSVGSGCGLFVWALADEQNHIAFFKLNYQTGLMAEKDSWSLNQCLLPASIKKDMEFFVINLDSGKIRLSSCLRSSGATDECNWIAEKILHVDVESSEQELLDTIADTMEDQIIKNCKNPQEKLFSYHKMMADIAAESGQLRMNEVIENIFEDDTDSADSCKERLAENQVPCIPILINSSIERTLKKKQKIKLSSGIEILVPPELLENENFFQYQNKDGQVTIQVKDIDLHTLEKSE